ncbi:hypothetical protein IEO21_04809 [Rhodonia placenta]|uniref:Uncharacterized protein n=1 Tax=Rhodonia placenta TaxID=104341 RepID=A0A8H7P316_9APHY|nr:hypothetical protein IEO21_04809 [Postia placenta]
MVVTALSPIAIDTIWDGRRLGITVDAVLLTVPAFALTLSAISLTVKEHAHHNETNGHI